MVDHAPKSDPSSDSNRNNKKKGLISIRELLKLIKVLIKRLCYRRKPSAINDTPDDNFEAIDISREDSNYVKNNQPGQNLGEKGSNMHCCIGDPRNNASTSPSGGGLYKHRNSLDKYCIPHTPSPLSRTTSPTSPPRSGSISRDKSRPDISHDEINGGSSSETLPRLTSRKGPIPIIFSESLSRNASRRSGPINPTVHSGPLSRNPSRTIFFSNSTGMILKPPAIEGTLECTLEELCYGCKKRIKITRDVITNNGQLTQEDELLSINVKPGWKKGTKITFEGMGNETLGNNSGDVNIVIAEKEHPLFTRQGDDLELAVEIPLVKALTGCTIPIPLLGGEETSLTIDDDLIIKPGDKRIVPGQGMPLSKEQGKRGDLKVVFLVEFPTELTEEKRSDIVSILISGC
ncbi:uncharacterized protein [Rutidosis leptorrhynchoides]|uniref:uncharacterized protein n=1 Tax=Rutidosis leptorrhynchoides TaxID=125765 RepID=UPI003A99D644